MLRAIARQVLAGAMFSFAGYCAAYIEIGEKASSVFADILDAATILPGQRAAVGDMVIQFDHCGRLTAEKQDSLNRVIIYPCSDYADSVLYLRGTSHCSFLIIRLRHLVGRSVDVIKYDPCSGEVSDTVQLGM